MMKTVRMLSRREELRDGGGTCDKFEEVGPESNMS
jgi:hypothetical protein